MRSWYRNIPIGLIIAIGIGIYGYVQVSESKEDSTTRSEDGKIVEAGKVGIEVLKIGDCIQFPSEFKVGDPKETIVSSLRAVPCTDLHDAELYSSKTLDFTPYPGEDALYGELSDFCIEDFESYTGLQFDSSNLYNIWPLVPLAESWSNGDRVVQCLAALSSGEKLSASIRV